MQTLFILQHSLSILFIVRPYNAKKSHCIKGLNIECTLNHVTRYTFAYLLMHF